MSKKEEDYEGSFDFVRNAVDKEGFDYAFRAYSHFEEVKDRKFQDLRKAYVKAADALEAYIEKAP